MQRTSAVLQCVLFPDIGAPFVFAVNKIILLLYNKSVNHYNNAMRPGQLNDFNYFVSHVEAKRRRWFVVANVINIIMVAVITIVGMNVPAFASRAKYAWAAISGGENATINIEQSGDSTAQTVAEVEFNDYPNFVGVMDVTLLDSGNPAQQPVADETPLPASEPSLQVEPNTISIPKISVSAPIVWNVSADKIQGELSNGVVHIGNTSTPGTPGNIFMTGHSSDSFWTPGNYKTVFVLLDKLAKDDLIALNYNGVTFRYKVYNSQVVSREEVSNFVLSDRPETLTLMTCYPVGTNWSRLIVQAERMLK